MVIRRSSYSIVSRFATSGYNEERLFLRFRSTCGKKLKRKDLRSTEYMDINGLKRFLVRFMPDHRPIYINIYKLDSNKRDVGLLFPEPGVEWARLCPMKGAFIRSLGMKISYPQVDLFEHHREVR